MQKKSLSFFSAILININIILGTGLFINSGILIKKANIFGTISYILVGLIMLPIVITITMLLKKYPDQGFYGFGIKSLNVFSGFIANWIYFFAKQNSAVVAIYVFASMMQEIIFGFHCVNNTIITVSLISFFTYCNMQKLETGLFFQYCLMIGKAILVSTVIGTGLFFSNSLIFNPTIITKTDFLSTIPLVVFSLLGFESICSMSMHASKENQLWKTVIGSYFAIIIIYIIYQTLIFGLVNQGHEIVDSFQKIFLIISNILEYQTGISHRVLEKIFYGCIALSALSGGYGILYSNQWNLYTLAAGKTFYGWTLFSQKNQSQMPCYASLAQLVICIFYLLLSNSELYILQQLSSFGCTITYGLSALFLLCKAESLFEKLIGLTAITSSLLLISICINNFLNQGFQALIFFIGIIVLGIALFNYKENYQNQSI